MRNLFGVFLSCCMQIDATAKTNNRGLPLVFVVGADGNWKTITWGAAILGPGEKEVCFDWVLRAIRFVHGGACDRNCLLVSDGAAQIFNCIDALIAEKEFGGVRGRCAWHCINQKYNNEVVAGADKEEKAAIHQPILRAMYVLAHQSVDDADVDEAFDAIYSFLDGHVKEGHYSLDRLQKARQVIHSAQNIKRFWVECLMGEFTMGVNTNGRGEGENTAMKKNNPLVSSKSQVQNVHKADKHRQQNRHQGRTITNDSFGRKLPSGGKDAEDRQKLHDCLRSRLTEAGERIALRNRRRSKYHTVSQIGDAQKDRMFIVQEHANPKADSQGIWRPRPRAWKVFVVTIGDTTMLVCPCPLTNRFFQPCSHLYSVSRGGVSTANFGIRWYQDYLLGHLDDLFDSDYPNPKKTRLGITITADMDLDFPQHVSEDDAPGDWSDTGVVDSDSGTDQVADKFADDGPIVSASALSVSAYQEFKVTTH
jgi:hypothetical protein